MGYLFLAGAIVAEVIGTTALKFAGLEGTNRLVSYTVVGLGYVAAFALLGQSLATGVPLGVAYALWAGIGVVLIVVISWLLFAEPLTVVQIAGMVLVVGGVMLLEVGGRH